MGSESFFVQNLCKMRSDNTDVLRVTTTLEKILRRRVPPRKGQRQDNLWRELPNCGSSSDLEIVLLFFTSQIRFREQQVCTHTLVENAVSASATQQSWRPYLAMSLEASLKFKQKVSLDEIQFPITLSTA